MRTAFVVLAAASAAAAGIGTFFARAMRRASARLSGRSTMLETSFGGMEYAETGTGAPVLCIHGAAGGFDQALDMTGPLAGHGFRLIAPSRFGYLRSALPTRLTVAQQADAYAELLDHLGIEKAALVGISAGAWSCLVFALRHPERCRALVLLVPANALPPGVAIRGGALTRAFINSNFAAWCLLKLTALFPGLLAETMLGTCAAVLRTAAPADRARAQEILDHLLPVSRRIDGMTFDVATAAAPPPLALEAIACPVLALSAEDDVFGTAGRAREIAAAVQDGKAVILPTGGHALIGREAQVLHEATAFLAGLAS